LAGGAVSMRGRDFVVFDIETVVDPALARSRGR
jgi:hypothetical protein